jgi:hypothetical protein
MLDTSSVNFLEQSKFTATDMLQDTSLDQYTKSPQNDIRHTEASLFKQPEILIIPDFKTQLPELLDLESDQQQSVPNPSSSRTIA